MSWNIPDEIIPIIAIVSVFGFLTLSMIVHYVYKAYCFGRLTKLKERLLESGMTSGEIERIINAGMPPEECAAIREKKPPLQRASAGMR